MSWLYRSLCLDHSLIFLIIAITNFTTTIIIILTLTELGLGVRIALIRICFFVERGVTGQDLTWCIQIIYTTEEM